METHTFTAEQVQKYINAVDCVVEDEGEDPAYDEQLYTAEVEAFRAHGSFD